MYNQIIDLYFSNKLQPPKPSFKTYIDLYYETSDHVAVIDYSGLITITLVNTQTNSTGNNMQTGWYSPNTYPERDTGYD